MGEHFDRHRGDAERLAGIASARGTAMSSERAYRAWSRHSEASAAGWLVLDGDEDVLAGILERQEESMAVEDLGALVAHRDEVGRLASEMEGRGVAMEPARVASAWADRSAAEGADWVHLTWLNLREAADHLEGLAPAPDAPAP